MNRRTSAFIGKGMLTAAVCGDLFASPSVDAVLTAIQAVTGEAGCLLIVKKTTPAIGFNFGLAAEKARRLGYNVEMLIVGDDISLPDNKQPRGIAGTILVHKVAGYFAERGFNLATVLREAQYAANHTASIGVALASCHPAAGSGKRAAPSARPRRAGDGHPRRTGSLDDRDP